MSLMKVLEDGQQVEVLGEVKSVDEALKTLGIAKEDWESYRGYEQDKGLYEDVVKALKLESGVLDLPEILRGEFFKIWKTELEKNVQSDLKEAHEHALENDPAFGTGYEMYLRFGKANEMPADEIARVIENTLNSRRGEIRDDADAANLRRYKDFVYKSHIGALDDREEVKIRQEAYQHMVEATRDELLDAVEVRRARALPFAIETFNKIQGRKLP